MKTDQESQPSPPPSPTPSQTNPSIRGYVKTKKIFIFSIVFSRDPATRKFAIFFLSALAIITIGVGIGIGVGNLAHYST